MYVINYIRSGYIMAKKVNHQEYAKKLAQAINDRSDKAVVFKNFATSTCGPKKKNK